MRQIKILSYLFVIACLISYSWLEELTFELEDNARQCFHEMILNETKCTLEFQVILICTAIVVIFTLIHKNYPATYTLIAEQLFLLFGKINIKLNGR